MKKLVAILLILVILAAGCRKANQITPAAHCAAGVLEKEDIFMYRKQIIAVLLDRAKDGVSLVIAPSSVCGNWRHEIRRCAPSLRPCMAYDEGAALASRGAMAYPMRSPASE